MGHKVQYVITANWLQALWEGKWFIEPEWDGYWGRWGLALRGLLERANQCPFSMGAIPWKDTSLRVPLPDFEWISSASQTFPDQQLPFQDLPVLRSVCLSCTFHLLLNILLTREALKPDFPIFCYHSSHGNDLPAINAHGLGSPAMSRPHAGISAYL